MILAFGPLANVRALVRVKISSLAIELIFFEVPAVSLIVRQVQCTIAIPLASAKLAFVNITIWVSDFLY